MTSLVVTSMAATGGLPSCGVREVFVDTHERVSQDVDLVIVEQRPQLAVGVLGHLLQLGEAPAPGGGDEDEQPAAVVGVGPTLDVAVGLQAIEMSDERRWFDVHEVGELALARATRARGLPQQYPVPEARALGGQPLVEHVVHGPVPEVQATA